MLSLIQKADNHEVACDTETSSLKWYNGFLVGHCIGISVDGVYYGFYIPVRHEGLSTNYPDPSGVEDILDLEIYSNPILTKIFFNMKFDINFLRNSGIEPGPKDKVEDAMLLMFLRDENEPNHRLKTLGAKYIEREAADEADKVASYFKSKRCTHYGQIPVDILGPYGAKDSILTLKLWRFGSRSFIDEVDSTKRDGVRRSIYKLERNFAWFTADMERAGIPIDTSIIQTLEPDIREAAKKLEERIYELVGVKFNIDSNPETNRILVDKMKFDAVKSSPKTGEPSWGRAELMALGNELGEDIACYRNLTHSLSTFIEGLPKWEVRGRIHCSYNQIGARTGRASASEPNLQQMPKRLPRYGKIPEYAQEGLRKSFAVRNSFRAPEGFKIVSIDQSQFELRLLDHYAQDPRMHEAFEKGLDVHSYTACLLFNHKYEDFVKAYKEDDEDAKFYRTIAKEENFAIVYGAGPKRLRESINAYGISITLSEAREFYWRHKEVFSGVATFVDNVISTIKRRGYIFNQYGRHKRTPADKAYAGINYLIQGVTADMLKEAAMKCDGYLRYMKLDTRVSIMVHDEIVFTMPNNELSQIPQLKKLMEDFPWCRCPIVAEPSIGPSWGEQESYHG